jgi:hypothetical protein
MIAQDPIAKLRAAYRRWDETKGHSVEDWIAFLADDVKIRSVADGMRFTALRRRLPPRRRTPRESRGGP